MSCLCAGANRCDGAASPRCAFTRRDRSHRDIADRDVTLCADDEIFAAGEVEKIREVEEFRKVQELSGTDKDAGP